MLGLLVLFLGAEPATCRLLARPSSADGRRVEGGGRRRRVEGDAVLALGGGRGVGAAAGPGGSDHGYRGRGSVTKAGKFQWKFSIDGAVEVKLRATLAPNHLEARQ